MKKIYQITPEGKKELEAELEQLKSRRVQIADEIANARDYGDLSENAEYDSAREEQTQVEGRIADIEDILKNASLITAKNGNGRVQVGSTVVLENGSPAKVTYTIVGPVEANPAEGKISDESPIGSALLSKKAGDSVVIATPKGDITYKIVAIK